MFRVHICPPNKIIGHVLIPLPVPNQASVYQHMLSEELQTQAAIIHPICPIAQFINDGIKIQACQFVPVLPIRKHPDKLHMIGACSVRKLLASQSMTWLPSGRRALVSETASSSTF